MESPNSDKSNTDGSNSDSNNRYSSYSNSSISVGSNSDRSDSSNSDEFLRVFIKKNQQITLKRTQKRKKIRMAIIIYSDVNGGKYHI